MVAPVAAQVCTAGAGGATVGGAVAAALQFFAVAQCMIREPWPEQPVVFNESRFDFIVVGGGAAGSVVAARLAQLPNVTVLLVEAGPDPPTDTIVPAYKGVWKGGPYDWNFTSVADPPASTAFSAGLQPQPSGRMLGGSASGNDMIYVRGFPKDFQTWADAADDQSWNWDTILQYYKKSENLSDEKILNDPKLMQYHSVEGEIVVSRSNHPSKAVDVFLKSFNELGYDIVDDMSYPGKFGVGRLLHTIRNGQRESSATAYISRRNRDDKGILFVLRNAFVTKVLLDTNKTAYAVQVTREEETHIYYANLEIILSVGVFNTPKLLMLSGIGPRRHLEEMGIEVVQDLPVGEGLHDHAMVLTYLAADSDLCTTLKPEDHMEMIKYLYDRSGALAVSDSMGLYLSLNGTTDDSVPDFAIYPACVPKNANFREGCKSVLNFREDICEKLGAINEEKELLSFAVVNLYPVSRGYVRLASKDPAVNPIINTGTFKDLRDLEGYPEVMGVVYSLVNTSYLQAKGAYVVELELEECQGKSGEEADWCQAQVTGTSAWHGAGTAALGSVVESDLRVRGVRGLRVADASVMPGPVRGSTAASVIVVAERAFDFIKGDSSYNFDVDDV